MSESEPSGSEAESAKGRIMIVEDEDNLRQLYVRRFRRKGFETSGFTTAEAALEHLKDHEADVVLVDLSLPKMNGLDFLKRLRERRRNTESIMLTGNGNEQTAVEAIKLGAYHYLSKPVEFNELFIYINKAMEKRQLEAGYRDLQEVVERTRKTPTLVGESKVMKRLRDLIQRVAPNPTPVLIEGETGSGKDVTARLIHELSSRRAGPFVAINCGALDESLLQSELFGHKKGAFTSAISDRRGLFEMAHKGTLFIDELCEMSLEIQKKFLRVLENGEIRRIGDETTRTVDVRIVAATNRNVKDEVKAQRFRQDLYYRLNILPITTPPLRQHKEDIPELIDFFLKMNAGRYPRGAKVSPEAMKAFESYDWPGNVRELQAVLERGFVLSTDGVIRVGDCPGMDIDDWEPAGEVPSSESGPVSKLEGEFLTLEELEKQHLVKALDLSEGNKTQAARKLGISLRSLYRRLERHELS